MMIPLVAGDWRYSPAVALMCLLATAWVPPAASQTGRPALAPQAELQSQPESDTAAELAQYRRAYEAYNKAWASHAAAAGAYWKLISEKRQIRNGKRARGAACDE